VGASSRRPGSAGFALPCLTDRVVKVRGDSWYLHGRVVWLTPEQGGRRKGVPITTPEYDYAQVAYVPPHTFNTGLASFVLGTFEPGAWSSPADGRWLIVDNAGDQLVEPGDVVVVAEGRRISGYFHVESVDQATDSI
jgi:hypothetical protein